MENNNCYFLRVFRFYLEFSTPQKKKNWAIQIQNQSLGQFGQYLSTNRMPDSVLSTEHPVVNKVDVALTASLPTL